MARAFLNYGGNFMKSIFKSKAIRTFMCLVLMATMLIGYSGTAHAEITGTQTWTASADQSKWFTVTNYNLTKPKTMGFSGPLWIWVDFNKADSASYPPIYLTVEVRNLTRGTVAAHDLACVSDIKHYPIYTEVQQGDVLQFYFDVKTERGYTPPGPYRKANIQYGYSKNYGSWF